MARLSLHTTSAQFSWSALCLLAIGLVGTAHAQSPVLDATYGLNGRALGFYASPDYHLANTYFAARPDGSFYYVTVRDVSGTVSSRVGLMRSDGRGDPAFGIDGEFVIPRSQGESVEASDILVDSRGHALIVGTYQLMDSGLEKAPFVIRIRPDGKQDLRLSSQRLDVGGPARAIAVAQSGGTYLVALAYTDGTCGVLAVGPEGVIQTAYGEGGAARLAIGSSCVPTDLATDAGGRAIVGLTATLDGEPRAVVIRLTRAGRHDQRYGTDGLYLPIPDRPSYLQAVVVNEDQRIHTAGILPGADETYGFVARGTILGRGSADGSLWRWISPSIGQFNGGNPGGALAVQPDGSSYVSTLVRNQIPGPLDLAIARLDRFGRLDPSFGDAGVYTQPSIPEGGPGGYFGFLGNSILHVSSSGRLTAGGIHTTTVGSQYPPYLFAYRTESAPPLLGPLADETAMASEVSIEPNPTAGRLSVRFVPTIGTPVSVTIVDALGRRVAVLVDTGRAEGPIEATWDAGSLASGVYLVVVQSGETHKVVPITVVR